MYPQRRCPVCTSDSYKIAYKKKDLRFLCSEYLFTVAECHVCGAGYVLDPPDETDLANFYPPAFYAANHASSGQKGILKKKLELLETFLSPQNGKTLRLLDVGTGGGEFVDFAQQRGWDAKGYEWSSTPQMFSNAVIQAPRLQGCFAPASFDVITAWAVMEHVYNVRETLDTISSLLDRNGLLIILVTNFNSIPARFLMQDDIPRHLNLFTPASLGKLLQQKGLIPIKYIYSDDIFSGTHRGLLVFLLKRLFGEKHEDILAQHRAPGRREEFCTMLRGKKSRLNTLVCDFDRLIFSPFFDWLMNTLNKGFTMTVIAKKS